MKDDDLRSLLHARALDAPDAGAVRASIHRGIARRHRRRQVASVGGVAATVAGLVIGAQLLQPATGPGLAARPAATQPRATGLPPASVGADPDRDPTQRPTVAASPAPILPQDASRSVALRVDFLDAGYDYTDAVELARLWNVEVNTAKVLGGVTVSAGATLPVAPGVRGGGVPQRVPQDDVALAAFEDAGLGPADAVELAALWGESDVPLVKAMAGQQLLLGQEVGDL